MLDEEGVFFADRGEWETRSISMGDLVADFVVLPDFVDISGEDRGIFFEIGAKMSAIPTRSHEIIHESIELEDHITLRESGALECRESSEGRSSDFLVSLFCLVSIDYDRDDSERDEHQSSHDERDGYVHSFFLSEYMHPSQKLHEKPHEKLHSYAIWYIGKYAPSIARLRAKLALRCDDASLIDRVLTEVSVYIDETYMIRSSAESLLSAGL